MNPRPKATGDAPSKNSPALYLRKFDLELRTRLNIHCLQTQRPQSAVVNDAVREYLDKREGRAK